MEGFPKEQLDNNINQEKFDELRDIWKLILKDSDSNKGYEMGESLNDFKNDFEKDGKKLKDYALGQILFSKNDSIDISDFELFDDEEHSIENFIKKLN